MKTLQSKFNDLQNAVDDELQERGDLVNTAILALIARKHHFQLGPPGVAKSLLVERIIARIEGWPEAGYFHRLLTKYTTDDELFGPPDIGELMQGNFKRKIDRKLPVAYVAFLDEIFKGNSSVLNALLLAMNERKFDDESGMVDIPIITIFGASNEMPEGEELGAMWDRLHIRHEVSPLQDGASFQAMIETTIDPHPESCISLEDIAEAGRQAAAIKVPTSIAEALRTLRNNLASEGISPTDRRWVDALSVIRAAAWMDGKKTVLVRHTRPLMHMMWDRPEDIRKVAGVILDLADPLEREAQDYYDKLLGLETAFREAINEKEGSEARSSISVETYTKMETLNEKFKALKVKIEKAKHPLQVVNEFDKRFKAVSTEVMTKGFGFDGLPGE